MDVFISYARTEIARARVIKDRLQELGLSVFFDTEGLDGGDVFPDVLDREVKTAGVVLGLWSPLALSRPWVRTECLIGKERGVLVPVALESLAPLDIPAAFFGIQQVNLSDFEGDTADPEWLKLVRSLARTLKRPDLLRREAAAHAHAPIQDAALRGEVETLKAELAALRSGTAPAPAPPPPSTNRKRADLRWLGVVLILGGVAAGVFWMLGQGNDGGSVEAAAPSEIAEASPGAGEALHEAPVQLDISTEAAQAVLMDYGTGQILFSKNGDEPVEPSSMSKIMTALMVFEALEAGSITLDTVFTTSEHAWRTGGFASGASTMCLDPAERVRVVDLLRGVIVLSGNDASIVLAEGLAGTEEAFAADMELRARELGLASSSFANATGWPDPDHKMSMRDLAELARITIRDHPDFYPLYAEREFDHCEEAPSNRFNRNPVLGLVPGADGLKTGHTEETGYGLVASAVQDGRRIILAMSGLPTNAQRAQEAERLLGLGLAGARVVAEQ